MSIPGWLMRGAVREDDISPTGCAIGNFASFLHAHPAGECNPQDDPHSPTIDRVVNHFYDPVHDRGLDIWLPPPINWLAPKGAKAVDWALGTVDAFGSPGVPDKDRRNHFTVMDARQAMYSALTGSNPDKTFADEEARKAWWATTFRSLGDVLHLVQDMAQPQHTKNEPHAGSILEAYIEARATGRSEYSIDGVTVRSLGGLHLSGYDIPRFKRYSDYWSTAKRGGGVAGGQGLADFANRAMFTAGTVIGASTPFTLPDRNPSAYGREDMIDPRLMALNAKVSFLTSRQAETQVAGRGARMLTESVFTDFSGKAPTYALTRYNLDDQADLLLPRAVAYSTGLLDYFFRGKIDLVKDQDRADGYLIRNLGDEDLRGRFALYYDAQDGLRKPVPDRDGKLLAWGAAAPMPPASEMLVTARFDTPADAKTPEEYILVFDGDMGEEKRSDESLGAVTAKVIRAPNSKLYLAGIDTQGRRMTLKADGAGVRLVHGFDANNRFVDTGERPPAFDAFKGVMDPVGPPPWTKQVVFEPGLRGTQYRVEALSGMGYLFSTDPKTQRWVTKTSNIRGWIARPASEPGIEYEFDIRVEGRALYYRRCAGYGSKVCGSYQYFDWPAELAQGILDHRFGFHPVSGDGTRVCGFPATTGYQGNVNPPGPYYLYQELSVAWDSQDQGQLACLTFNFDQGVLSVGKALLAEFPTSTASGSAAFYDAYPINRSEIAQGTVTNHGGAVIGYVEGKLHHRTSRFQGSYTSSLANYTWQAASQRTAMAWTFPEGTMELAGNCGLLASARFSTGAAPFGGAGPGGTGIGPAHALTQRAQDAIYIVHKQGCTAGDPSDLPVTKFRDVVITDGAYVIDSSPNGEIFFARSDLSVIIHEPRAHGVKHIDRASLPANLFKLVGVLWL